eukprot:TRINITY_DN43632_c0_g1_i1.p1 TRINITY_DN43632_c0_g1~~TRINITY_DN43632_c0_g1_i1.p1  ORF type:complete len:152 (-),score=26.02 TRINITY_DN43632_c0_g1_i1:203-658(-)
MLRSLVGSEMCIRDRSSRVRGTDVYKRMEFVGYDLDRLEAGDGVTYARTGDRVEAELSVYLPDGTEVWSSSLLGRPFVVTLGTRQVIQSVDWALGAISLGERVQMISTPEFAYGMEGISTVPAGTDLMLDLRLTKINGLRFEPSTKSVYQL